MSTIFVMPYIQRWSYEESQGVAVESARVVYNKLVALAYKKEGQLFNGVQHTSLDVTAEDEDTWMFQDDSLVHVFSALHISEQDIQESVTSFLASLKRYVFSVVDYHVSVEGRECSHAETEDFALDNFYPFLEQINVVKTGINLSNVEGYSVVLEFSNVEEIDSVRAWVDRATLANELQK